MKIGAGGYVTGIDIAPDGTKVVRADSAGAFIWNDATSAWKPLLTMASMPKGEVGHEVNGVTGVYEIAIAPSNSAIIYLVYNGYVFRSSDRGVTFTKTALARITAEPNTEYRTLGRKMAVDPANPDVVYVGSEVTGVYVTQDGGTTWARRTDIPAPTTIAGIAIAFDKKLGVTGGKTRSLFIMSAGNGVYHSADAGATFSQTAGGPLIHRHMTCDANGVVWLTDGEKSRDNIWSYDGTWKAIDTRSDQHWHCIAADPGNPNHVVAGSESGALAQSFDAGRTWGLITDLNYPTGAGVRLATDIPWLAWTNEDYMSSGAICFDPSQNNKLYFVEGIGVWWTNPPATLAYYAWQSQSAGIEQLVSTVFVVPPGGSPVYFAWDRPVFKLDDLTKFPATHGPNKKYPIIVGWSGGFAIDDSRHIVGLINFWGREESGYSPDGGATWTKFASVPAEVSAGKIAGSIAVSNKNNIVWLTSNNGNPHYTKDGGQTWTQINIPGIPTTVETGWGWAYYLYRHVLTADCVTSGTFYMYNYKPECVGLYRSTDGGANWSRAYSSEIAPASTFNAQLAAVPGNAGHLFFTSGPLSGPKPGDSPFMRSTDGGSSWTRVSGVMQVYCCGFGKAATGSNYPAIFIAGYVNNVWGIYRSDDNAANWIKIGDYPLDNIDIIKTISGDMDRFGRVYVGFGGSGGAYAELVTS